MVRWAIRRLLGVPALCVLLACAMLLAGCPKRRDEDIRIGAVLALTGSAAIWGENAKNGMELAREELNAAGGIGGRPIEITYEDSQSDPKSAVAALRKILSTSKVPAVIGDIASGNVLAMAPVAESEKVVLISPGASNPDISHAGDYVFRNFPSDALEGKIDARYAFQRLGWKHVAVLYIKNGYGEGVSRVFKETFEGLGGKVTLMDSFAQGANDMRGQLTKLKDASIQGVYLPGYPAEMGRLLKQAKELGVTKPFLSTQAFDDPQLLDLAGGSAEGILFSTPEPGNPSDPTVAAFHQNYQKKYGKAPGFMSDTGYDALRIIAEAIRTGGYEAEAIRRQLLSMRNFPGAAGPTTFDEYGDVPRGFIFKTVKGGQFVATGQRMGAD